MSTYNKTSKPRFRIESKCERFGVSNFTRDMLQLSRVKVQLRNADAHGLRDMYSDVFGPADTKLDLGIRIELERTFRLRSYADDSVGCFPEVTGGADVQNG